MLTDSERPDEMALAKRWADGDRHAGKVIAGLYYMQLRRFFISNIGNDDLREDLIQETFLRLTKGIKAFKGKASLRTFVFRIAENTLNDHLRRQYRRGNFDPLTQSVEEVDTETPSRIIAELQRNRRLLACVRRLPVAFKHTVELRYWHGFSTIEIAEVLELENVATVRSRLFSARSRLRACLADAELQVASTEDDVEVELEDVDPELVGDLRELGQLVHELV
jgi:RNA polymerase sigma-70 factor (ECF subfamily)